MYILPKHFVQICCHLVHLKTANHYSIVGPLAEDPFKLFEFTQKWTTPKNRKEHQEVFPDMVWLLGKTNLVSVKCLLLFLFVGPLWLCSGTLTIIKTKTFIDVFVVGALNIAYFHYNLYIILKCIICFTEPQYKFVLKKKMKTMFPWAPRRNKNY